MTPIPPAFLSLLARQFRLSRAHQLLEIGCGEGYLTRALAARVAQVDGLDQSPAVLASAESRGRDDSHRILYIASRVEDFTPARDYNLVIALEAFHLVEESARAAVLQRLAAALALGGSLCVAWAEFFWEKTLFEIYASAFDDVGITWGPLPNLAVLDFRSLAESALPDLDLEYGDGGVEVAESYSLDQISGYLSSVSKANVLSSGRKQKLRNSLLERFRDAGFSDPAAGVSRYVIHYFTKRAD
jgi:SAM-dependent methyltransferase